MRTVIKIKERILGKVIAVVENRIDHSVLEVVCDVRVVVPLSGAATVILSPTSNHL